LKAQEKNIFMETDIPEGLAPVKADRDKLSQILLNIIENAIKFTPESGEVSIGARDLHNGDVEITVADSGIGIPKDEIPRIGERFYRVDKTRSREMGGTGLGLSIVKHLIQAHEGTLTIESQPGRGTTVQLSLPSY
jgi:signal transduction histidine kinase